MGFVILGIFILLAGLILSRVNDRIRIFGKPGSYWRGYKDKIVRPIVRTRIRDNAVYYDAVSLYSTKRDEFQVRICKAIVADEFKKRGLLENLLIRNITLPASVKNAIEAKINAEREAQKMQLLLQKNGRRQIENVLRCKV